MGVGAVQTVVVCNVAANPCPVPNQATVYAYLIDPSQGAPMELMLAQSGIDWSVVNQSFIGGLTFFALGAGIGMIINVLKKR